MTKTQTRRRALAMLSLAGASFACAPAVWAGEEKLETTSVRLKKSVSVCVAPESVAERFLRAEGFTDVRYVLLPNTEPTDAIAHGAIDFGMNYASVMITGVDRGLPVTMLAGVQVGCFELFVHDETRGIAGLKGKSVGVRWLGSPEHMFLSMIAANVGINPRTEINWTAAGKIGPKQAFIEGRIDAFLGVAPVPQELRAKHIGRVVVNSMMDRPWSQYFCCMLGVNNDYFREHPVATKRVVRAILKAADLCASDPAGVARTLIDGGFTKTRPEYVLQALREIPFDRWREYDAEDTVRFYALRLHDLGFVQSVPQQIIAKGTDWRFLNELKRELKA